MNINFHKAIGWLLALVGGGLVAADVARVEVMYVNGFSYLDPLVDQEGVPLTAGGPANDDGAIFQVGYFQGVSHMLPPASFSEADWSRFTPLTGMGSDNWERHPTTIGGIDSRASGPFGFLFYPSPVAIELDTELDAGVPVGGSARLGVRFFNTADLEESTHSNIVTSSALGWVLPDPEPSPDIAAVLDMDADPLTWASGPGGAFQTSLSLMPEPGVAGLVAMAALVVLWRRAPVGREGCPGLPLA